MRGVHAPEFETEGGVGTRPDVDERLELLRSSVMFEVRVVRRCFSVKGGLNSCLTDEADLRFDIDLTSVPSLVDISLGVSPSGVDMSGPGLSALPMVCRSPASLATFSVGEASR